MKVSIFSDTPVKNPKQTNKKTLKWGRVLVFTVLNFSCSNLMLIAEYCEKYLGFFFIARGLLLNWWKYDHGAFKLFLFLPFWSPLGISSPEQEEEEGRNQGDPVLFVHALTEMRGFTYLTKTCFFFFIAFDSHCFSVREEETISASEILLLSCHSGLVSWLPYHQCHCSSALSSDGDTCQCWWGGEGTAKSCPPSLLCSWSPLLRFLAGWGSVLGTWVAQCCLSGLWPLMGCS